MDKSWIELRRTNMKAYIDGVKMFFDFAYKNNDPNAFIYCPCKKCKNRYCHNKATTKIHILLDGFMTSYKIWNKHGERVIYRSEPIDRVRLKKDETFGEKDGAKDVEAQLTSKLAESHDESVAHQLCVEIVGDNKHGRVRCMGIGAPPMKKSKQSKESVLEETVKNHEGELQKHKSDSYTSEHTLDSSVGQENEE